MTYIICGNCRYLMKYILLESRRIRQFRFIQPLTFKCQRFYSQNHDHGHVHSKPKINLADFPIHRIRNFSIIAHVDHGKSTLADRLLELTGVIDPDKKNEQVLDKLQVERERGITVKANTVSLLYDYDEETYLLNLIDTPGHVDFNYEVARSLAACQGVILIVDANQGVQAQTVANFFLAFEANLSIVTVMNKIDLKVAKPEEVAQQIETVFDIQPSEVIKISAKLGIGIEDVLKAVIEQIPPPEGDRDADLQALLFDSSYDRYRGVVVHLAVKEGAVRKGDRVLACHSGKTYEVQEIGILYPGETPTDVLYAGQVGYMYANMKNPGEAMLGDTVCLQARPVEPLSGFKDAKPMVFAGVFPMDQSEFPSLQGAIQKLVLNDNSVQVNKDSSAALGQGFRLGFLGLLHMDVFRQRLEQEYDANVIVTAPNVPYKVHIKGTKNIKFYGKDQLIILNPCHLPDKDIVTHYEEPIVMGTIISPDDYIGEILSLVLDRRGEYQDQHYIDEKRIMFKVLFPLNEIVVDFFDKLKSVTSGYASFDYEDHGYAKSDLIKVDIVLNGMAVDELTQITHVSKARRVARHTATRLKETLPQQLFEIIVQAKVGSKVLARETIKALRKDVLAKCYGGDITRKMKLLRRQAEGKKRMKMFGNIQVPKETFIKILQKD